MAQRIERGALSMSLPTVQKYNVSPLLILGHCFDIVSLGKALNQCFTSNASLHSGENEYLVGDRS